MTDDMATLTRRSLLRSSVGFAATGALTRLHIANAAVTTATVWWVQGFAEQEDVSFKKPMADYEKASGNTLDPTRSQYPKRTSPSVVNRHPGVSITGLQPGSTRPPHDPMAADLRLNLTTCRLVLMGQQRGFGSA
jgi:hypothetical protein